MPHLEGHECYQVTGKHAVDAVIFRNNFLAQHPGILIFPLPVNGNIAMRNKVVFRINDAVVRIQGVAVIINVVSHHIQPPANRNGNIGALGEKFKEEADQLKTSVVILFREIAVLPFYLKIIFNQIRGLQYKMVIQCDGDNKNFSDFLARRSFDI